MTQVINLFDVTGNASFRGSTNMQKSINELFDNGEIQANDRMVVIYMRGDKMEVGFIQKGLDALGMLSILEVAKLQIYNDFILNKD